MKMRRGNSMVYLYACCALLTLTTSQSKADVRTVPVVFVVEKVNTGNGQASYRLLKRESNGTLTEIFNKEKPVALPQRISGIFPSPNGRYIVLRSSPNFIDKDTPPHSSEVSEDSRIHNVYVMSLKTKEIFLLDGTGAVKDIKWRPDGEMLAIRGNEAGKDLFTFYDVNKRIYHRWKPEQPICDWNWYADAIPSIVYYQVGQRNIQFRSPSGTILKKSWTIPEKNPPFLLIRPSPDGHSCLLLTQMHSYIKDTDNWREIPLPSGFAPSSLLWSPDSQKIVYENIEFSKTGAYPAEKVRQYVVAPKEQLNKGKVLFTWREDDTQSDKYLLQWSKDSQGIYFVESDSTKRLRLKEYSLRGTSPLLLLFDLSSNNREFALQ